MTMKKVITSNQLAEIVTVLLANPSAAGQDLSPENHEQFMIDIASVVADYCGGDLDLHSAAQLTQRAESAHGSLLVIEENDSLPADGGIWMPYENVDGSGLSAEAYQQQAAMSLLALKSTIGSGRRLVAVQHEHRHGTSMFNALVPKSWSDGEIIRSVVAAEDIDFEPDRDESLTVTDVFQDYPIVLLEEDLVDNADDQLAAGVPAP